MEDCFTVYCIHGAKNLAGGYLVPCLNINRLHVAIQGEIVSVLDKYALMVSREYCNLAYRAVEYCPYLRVGAYGQ